MLNLGEKRDVYIFEEGERKKAADQSDYECSKRCGRFVVYLYTFYMIFLIKHIWCDYVIYCCFFLLGLKLSENIELV